MSLLRPSTLVHNNKRSLKPARRPPHLRQHPHRAHSRATRNFRTPEYGRSRGADRREVAGKASLSNKAARHWD